MEITLTNHAQRRASQRGIDERQIKFCIDYGDQFHKTGALFFMVTKKCLKKIKQSFGAYMPRLDGIVVLGYMQSNAFVVTTVYKNHNALKDIKRKSKRSYK